MSRIESVKTYAGKDLETIFFRPLLTGENAEQLGIRVLYNMPVPTTLHFWKRSDDILQKYSAAGWTGSSATERYQKTINLSKVKAEIGYSAEDYFSLVYELITGRPEVNLDDLSGTELEEAETALFKQSIAESIRGTMWLGKTTREDELNTFDGIIPSIYADVLANKIKGLKQTGDIDAGNIQEFLYNIWRRALPELKALKSEGQLVMFATTDLYNFYEESLDNDAVEAAYLAKQEGRSGLSYRGIPLVDLKLDRHFENIFDLPQQFVILTDRRNLALAVNTSDYPGTEVRMWYNPDLMENRQRAIFMAGADYLLPELVSFGYLDA